MLKAFSRTFPGGTDVIQTECGICQAISPNELIAGAKHPKVLNCTAIWDTGATSSAISPRVVQQLGLKPVQIGRNYTAAGPIDVLIYAVNILLPCEVGVSMLFASCNDLHGTDVLIGMDVISRGDFAISHENGNLKFSFQIPSTHTLDFADEMKHTPAVAEKKPRPNDKCPCGSGRKYKNCHGKA